MFKVDDEVVVTRALLDDGESPYLDRIVWDNGRTTAFVSNIRKSNPASWNTEGYDLTVRFNNTNEYWGCHMRAISAAVLDKSSISRRLVELYRV